MLKHYHMNIYQTQRHSINQSNTLGILFLFTNKNSLSQVQITIEKQIGSNRTFLILISQNFNNLQMSNRYADPGKLVYHQQLAHYAHIQNPRSTLKINLQPKKSRSLYHHTKTTNQKDRLRKLQNKKMLFSLLDIYNGQGLLSKMEEFSSRKSEEKRHSSLIRSFKKMQQEKELRKQNKQLIQTIINIEPVVGKVKDWEKGFELHKQIQKKLCATSIWNQGNLPDYRAIYKQRRHNMSTSQKRGAKEQKLDKNHPFTSSKKHSKRRKTKNQLESLQKKVEQIQ